MTRKTKLAGLAVACVLAMSITTSAFAHGSGNSNSSQGQMPMMGSGMMGSQMPMMGGWGGMQVLRRDLTADEVKHMMEHRLAWSGNQNVKLGNVSEKEGDVIEVEITDKDGKVVQKLKVDRHTGWMQIVQ